jgi:glycosyltransferase involved in cell wall biosynthesis
MLHVLGGLDRSRWQPVLLCRGAGSAGHLAEAGRLGVAAREIPAGARAGLAGMVRGLRAVRPAIVHAHLNRPGACRAGLIAARIALVPAVVATQQLYLRLPWPARIHARLLATLVDRYIAVSRHTGDLLSAELGIPATKIRVVANGVPPEEFETPPDAGLRAILAGAPACPIVLAVARLDPQKDLDCLVDAAALVPEARFVVAGEGPERARLESRARARGVGARVLFLGERSDVAALLAACDVFVLPSRAEGLPLAVLEAMAAARPVVCSAIAGIDEIVVPDETGFLVPPSDPVALAKALHTALEDPGRAARLGAAARARVRARFSSAGMVRGVTAVYEELLAAREPIRGRP